MLYFSNLKQSIATIRMSLPIAILALVAAPALGQIVYSTSAGDANPDAFEQTVQLQKSTMKNMRSIAICVESYKIDHGSYPGPTDGTVSASWLVDRVQPTYIRELPLRDEWGNDLLYRSTADGYTVLSKGEDGVIDPAIPAEDQDLVFQNGEFVSLPRHLAPPKKSKQQDRHERAMGTLRTIATCFEAFGIDNNRYPGPTEKFTPVNEVRDLLEPMYVLNMPANDPWGRPVLFWSDGQNYRIVSGGANRELETSERGDLAGSANEAEMDLVFENGSFTQAPERLTNRSGRR